MLNVRACIGVTQADGQRAVLIESNLHLLAGDVVGVTVLGASGFFTERAEQDMGNVVPKPTG